MGSFGATEGVLGDPVESRNRRTTEISNQIKGVNDYVLRLQPSISRISPAAESIGSLESPLRLPSWLINIALALGVAAASAERALQMRYGWLDSAGN